MLRTYVWFGLLTTLCLAAVVSAAGDLQPQGERGRDALDDLICVADFSVTAFPYSRSDDLGNAGNDCGLRSSQDHIYRIVIPATGSYTFTTCGTTAPTDLWLYLSRGCCGVDLIDSDNNGCGLPAGPATLSCIYLQQGTYHLAVEAQSPGAVGPYTLDIFQCPDPCDEAFLVDGVYNHNDGSVTVVQTVSGNSGSPHYDGPFTHPLSCRDNDPLYGFGYMNWFDDDFGWRHTFLTGGAPQSACIFSAQLLICGYEIDLNDCWVPGSELGICEFDRVTIDDSVLPPTYLQGTNLAKSVTVFDLEPVMLTDGLLDVFVDFDSESDQCNWAGMVSKSQLVVRYRLNDPPYTPLGLYPECTTADSALCVLVTGPTPADPNGDDVDYTFDWFLLDDDEWLPQNFDGPCVPASATQLGERWKVQVTAHDACGLSSEPWVVEFLVVLTCNPNPIIGWDYGDLNPQCYPTGTELTGGPANPIFRNNLAWLGQAVTVDTIPNTIDLDGADDGVVFLNAPWEPCTEVCVDVTITTGPGYDGEELFLWAWKDGNLDCDFSDTACETEGANPFVAAECLIRGAPITGLGANESTTRTFCFVDPGVLDLGVYDGVFRFRLLSERLTEGCVAALTSVDPLLGETEDYVIGDLQLSVELLGFDVVADGDAVLLTWSTASETHNDHFIIERRTAQAWQRISENIAGAGNSATQRNYRYRDSHVDAGTLYEYRLLSVDVNGVAEVVGTRQISYTTMSPAAITEFFLYSNYPNPFNPATTIAFDVAEAGRARLEVFDVTGRAVAVLTDGYRAVGHHSVSFDAASLPSGVYLYRLTTNSYSSMKKMILLK